MGPGDRAFLTTGPQDQRTRGPQDHRSKDGAGRWEGRWPALARGSGRAQHQECPLGVDGHSPWLGTVSNLAHPAAPYLAGGVSSPEALLNSRVQAALGAQGGTKLCKREARRPCLVTAAEVAFNAPLPSHVPADIALIRRH